MGENENQNQTNKKIEDLNSVLAKRAKREKIKGIVKKIVIVIIIAYIFIAIKNGPKNQVVEEEFPYEEYTVDKGKVEVVVNGDGTVQANSLYSITPKVTGEILKDNVELNQFVNKGDVLYVIDSKDINASLNQSDLAIQQSQVALEQAKLNYNSVQKQMNDLKIYATTSGYVDNLRIDKGAYVSNMSPVCDVREKNSFEITLPFVSTSANEIEIGDKANVFFVDFLTNEAGYVVSKTDNSMLKTGGSQVTNVVIRAEVEGYSIQNAKARATVYTSKGTVVTSTSDALFTAINSDVIVSNGTGTVKEVYVKNGTYVKQGDLIAILENENLDTQRDSAQMAIKNAEIAVKNAQNGSSTAKNQLDNYYITAPISGKIIYKNAKKGDVISSYQMQSSNVMAVVADVETLKFDVQIDELDISKIKIGQEVLVKVEALDNKEFVGVVSNINTIGVSSAGMTNYTVSIEMPGDEMIYTGMTVDAMIKIDKKENALRVPLTAVRKGDVVYKKANDPEFQDENTSIPKGYEKVKVELGLNDGDYIEILSGLLENDVVLVDKKTESGLFDMSSIRDMMMEE